MSSFTKGKKNAEEVNEVDPDLSEDEEEEEKDEAVEPPKEEDTSLANSDVTTKYQEAAKIAQSTLTEVIAMCVAGAKVVDICRAGDSLIEQKSALIFRNKSKKSQIEKGIAFPVCLSVNECVCHNSPLSSDDTAVLADGDMVKIDVGCHVDGYIAVVAHTVVVGVTVTSGVNPTAPLEGSTADVMNAAYAAAEVAMKLIKPNNTNKMVSEAIQKVATAYGVNLISGTVMHQMKRYVIDGNKVIILRDEPDQKVEECTFEQFEVYAVDVAMTSGDGKPREKDTRTTVFKRAVDKSFHLRMKGSRAFYSEMAKKFPTLPFTLRSFPDEKAARLGIRECVAHELILPYPVLYERPGDKIAHVKFTILLLQGGTSKITGISLPEGVFVSAPDKQLPEDILAILSSQNKKKKKKKTKKTGSGAGAAAGGEEEEDA